MDVSINGKKFIVIGASSGFGFAVAKALTNDGAFVTMVARDQEKLSRAQQTLGHYAATIAGDITNNSTMQAVTDEFKKGQIDGLLVNAGGPPAMSFEDSSITDWDDAYKQVLRWKVDLILRVLPFLKEQEYGRILFIESASVKQPIENLVLSNSFRMAVVGFVKTLSQEIAGTGVNINIIAPGFHKTSAVNRIIAKKSEKENISLEEAEKQMKDSIPLKITGNPDDFAKLAVWLLSPSAAFVSGQVYYIDGGAIRATL